MLAIHPKKKHGHVNIIGSRAGDEGFVQVREPIPIILARDEELGLVGSERDVECQEMPTPPPPAYGLWRCSVVGFLPPPTSTVQRVK